MDQENFYKQARCVYNIQTVYESLSFLYVVSYFFAQPSFDSFSPYTAQQRVNWKQWVTIRVPNWGAYLGTPKIQLDEDYW